MAGSMTATERVTALALIGEAVVEAVRESGLLKAKRRKPGPRTTRKAANEPAPKKKKTGKGVSKRDTKKTEAVEATYSTPHRRDEGADW